MTWCWSTAQVHGEPLSAREQSALTTPSLLSTATGGAVIHEVIRAGESGAKLPEAVVLARFADAAAAVEYLHSQSPPIAHRDIKLENMLLTDTKYTADSITKLCDFGSCSTWQGSLSRGADITRMEDVVDRTTTSHYRAPELADLHARLRVGPAVDVWALGVVLYKLMFHVTPFEDSAGNAQRMGILSGRVKVPTGHGYSPEAIALMRACLTYQPTDRPSVADVIVQGSGTCREWPARHRRTVASAASLAAAPAPQVAEPPTAPKSRGSLQPTDLLPLGSQRVSPRASGTASLLGQGGGGFQRTLAASPGQDPWGAGEGAGEEEEFWAGEARGGPVAGSGQAPPAQPAQGATGGSKRGSAGGSGTRRGSVGGGTAASVMETMQTRMMQLFGGNQEKRRWAIKATSGLTPGPPKAKYVRRLITDAYESGSATGTYTNVGRLPLSTDPVVAIKACVLLLRLWQQGPPHALASAQAVAGHLQQLVNTWAAAASTFAAAAGGLAQSCPAGEGELAGYVAAYGDMLGSKVRLHGDHPDFSPLLTSGHGSPGEVIALTGDVSVSSKLPSGYVSIQVAAALQTYIGSLMATHRVGTGITDPAVRSVVAVLGTTRKGSVTSPGNGSGASSGVLSGREWPVGPVEACVFGSAQPLLRETWNAFRAQLAILLQLRAQRMRAAAGVVNGGAAPQRTAASRKLDELCAALDRTLAELRTVHGAVARATRAGVHPCLDVLDGLPELPAGSPFEDPATAAELLASSSGPRAALVVPALGSPLPVASRAVEAHDGHGDFHDESVRTADEGIPGLRRGAHIATGAGLGAPVPLQRGDGEWGEDEDSGDEAAAAGQRPVSPPVAEEGMTAAAKRFFKRFSGGAAAGRGGEGAPSEAGGCMDPSAWICARATSLLTDSTAQRLLEQPDASFNIQQALALVWSMPGHERCAECSAPRPKWASINLGVLLCLSCSGVHRQLGTHVSKVRSLTLDDPEVSWLRQLLTIGNQRSNEFWLANYAEVKRREPGAPSAPAPRADMVSRSAWVRAKYVSRRYVSPATPSDGSHDPAKLASAGFPLCKYVLKASLLQAGQGAEGAAVGGDESSPVTFSPSRADAVADHAVSPPQDDPFENPGRPGGHEDAFAGLADKSAPTDDGWGTVGGAPVQGGTWDDPFAAQLPVEVVGLVKTGLRKTDVVLAVTDRSTPPVPRHGAEGDPEVGGGAAMGRAGTSRAEAGARGGSMASLASTVTSSDDDLLSLKGAAPSKPHAVLAPQGATPIPSAAASAVVGVASVGGAAQAEQQHLSAAGAFMTAAGSEVSSAGQPASPPDAAQAGGWGPPAGTAAPAGAAAPEPGAAGGAAPAKRGPEARTASLMRHIDGLWSSHVEIPWRDIRLGDRIGTGGFAEVFRGVYRGTDVAVKKLLHRPVASAAARTTGVDAGDVAAKAVADFKAEVALMTRLRHPNIVLFMGVVPEPLSLVTEYCARGNLFDLLHNPKVPLPWGLRKQMALDAARGMNYLHTSTPVIIHRDLKSLNLLVDDRWAVKVADFGLARFKANTASTSRYTMQCGTMQWMAPEVITGHVYTEKADVFSFGINLWELLTRDVPYRGMEVMQVGYAVLNAGLRPPIPADAPRDYAAVIKACLRADPAKRPTFAQIINALSKMLAAAPTGDAGS